MKWTHSESQKKDINKRDDYFKLVADTHKEFIELEKNDKSFNMSLEEYFEKKGAFLTMQKST